MQNNLKLSISVDELFQESASLRIRHNGSSEDMWLCFVSDDLSSDPEQLFKQELSKTIEFYGSATAQSGVNRSITFSGLSARNDYRAVAAAVNAYGEILSGIAELGFTTLRDPDVFTLKEDWKMAYTERKPLDGNKDNLYEYFSCSAPDGTVFYPCVVSAYDFQNKYSGSLRKLFESEKSRLESENVKWDKILIEGEGTYDCPRLLSGDYCVFMAGMTYDGELTGDYWSSDIKIEQEKASDEYERWVGIWNIKGESGSEYVSYTVKIEPVENNLTYKMYGWEGTSAEYYEEVPDENPVPLYFEASTGNVNLYSTYVGEVRSIAKFYIFGNIIVNDAITPVDIEGMKLAYFTYSNGMPYLNAAAYSFYDDLGTHYTGEFKSFSYAYSLIGFESYGYAALTPKAKVPDLLGIHIEKIY